MDEVKRVVSNLEQVLEVVQKEAIDLVETMHQLQSFLDEESRNIILGGLYRLLSEVRMEAASITGGTVLVLISPEGKITVNYTYSDRDSDSYLRRLKSQGYYILTLPEFSNFIYSLEPVVTAGNLIPIIEFLKANAEIEMPRTYQDEFPSSTAWLPHAPSAPSPWRPSDFLPALFPRPPLPRGLFKD
jgi:hypothetical protein